MQHKHMSNYLAVMCLTMYSALQNCQSGIKLYHIFRHESSFHATYWHKNLIMYIFVLPNDWGFSSSITSIVPFGKNDSCVNGDKHVIMFDGQAFNSPQIFGSKIYASMKLFFILLAHAYYHRSEQKKTSHLPIDWHLMHQATPCLSSI